MDTQKIISALGGTARTAALCEVTPGAVSQWIENGIPPARLMFLKLARPDVFATLDTTSAGNPADVAVSRGHGGRQPASPCNILDTVPDGSVVIPPQPS